MSEDILDLPGPLPRAGQLHQLALELGVIKRDAGSKEVTRAVLADEYS